MKLFVIESAEWQAGLFSILNEVAQDTAVVLRVDGLKDESGDNNWYYYSNGKQPAFDGLDWLTTSETMAGYDSLTVTNMAFPMEEVLPQFKVDGLPSDYLFYVVCEFTPVQE